MTGGDRPPALTPGEFAERMIGFHQVVLASTSPRRLALLRLLGLDVEVVPPAVDETAQPWETAEEQAVRLARAKARDVAERVPGRLVVAADTVVATTEGVLGKPRSAEEAKSMLGTLSGRTHTVITGVAVSRGGAFTSGAEATRVTFRTLGEDEIDAYVASGEPFDKAGAYGAQGLGSVFIAGVSGCFYNVVGLPLVRLLMLVRSLETRR